MITENIDTLRLVSDPFSGTEEELKAMFDCLEHEFNNHAVKGTGLSGIQVNLPYRVAIIRIERECKAHGRMRKTLISHNLYNAEVLRKEQPFTFKGEGCLSVPGEFKSTKRFNFIEIKNGDGEILRFSGFDAVVVQHELDHWDGVLFTDHAVETEGK